MEMGASSQVIWHVASHKHPVAPATSSRRAFPKHAESSKHTNKHRSARFAATADPKDAHHASRTGRHVAPPTESPGAPQYAAMRRPWSRRTRTCAPRSLTSRPS
jgi:hypothetical protein